MTTPSALSKVASAILFDGAATPPVPGGELRFGIPLRCLSLPGSIWYSPRKSHSSDNETERCDEALFRNNDLQLCSCSYVVNYRAGPGSRSSGPCRRREGRGSAHRAERQALSKFHGDVRTILCRAEGAGCRASGFGTLQAASHAINGISRPTRFSTICISLERSPPAYMQSTHPTESS